MRLRRLDLTRYGKFTDFSIDFGEHVAGTPDMHIVYGLNEAGKSTSLSAYLDLLFGIEERTRYGFLHQGKAMEIGGCLEFDGQAHDFKRVKQRNNSLLDAGARPVNEAILGVPLAGLTRDAYRMMFSLDDQTLEDGGNAILESKGDLGELLFSASAGLAGINSILEAVIAEADSIFRKRASSTKVAGLKRQIAELKSQREEIDIQASAYRALTATLEKAEAAYDTAMKETGATKARQDEVARILRAYPLASDYRKAEQELTAFRDLPSPPSAWEAALPNLIVEDTRLQTELAGIQQREHKARGEREGLAVDDRLAEIGDSLEQLSDSAARYATALEDLPKRKNALVEAGRKVNLILATLGKSDVQDPKSLVIPASTLGALRDLISDRSGIEVARQSAGKEYDAARQALESEQRANQALQSSGVPIDGIVVARIQSALSRLRDGNLVAELRLAERGFPVRRQTFDDAIGQLHPWTGDGDALRRALLPAADRVETWKSSFSVLDKRRSMIIDRKRELETRQAEGAVRLAALRGAASVLDDEEARTALLERDEAWQQHLTTLDRETAERFEDQMRKTDAVASARLDGAKQLEELRSLTSEIAINHVNIGRQQELLYETDLELANLRSEIRAEISPEKIQLRNDVPTIAWLTTISQWTENRSAALAAWDDLRRATREVEEAKLALAVQLESLAEALQSIGVEIEGLGIDALQQAADNALGDHAAHQVKRAEADKRIRDLEARADQRKAALNDAVAKFEEWHREWTSTLRSTWFADQHGSVGALRELLGAIAGLPEALREQDDLQHRINSMEADRKFFVDMVARLFNALGENFEGSNPLAAAKDLKRRHESAQQILTKRKALDEALSELVIEGEKLANEIAIHSARKREMTEFFRAETLEDVRKALDHCRKRDDLAERQSVIERQIIRDMQSQSLQDALSSLAHIDILELQREQAELVSRLERLDGHTKDLFANRARAQDSLTAIGGDDSVARLEAKRRTLLLETEDLARRYLRLRSGSLVAEHGIRAYRDKHRSSMMNRASEAFRLITRGEYRGLATRPDKDREALIGLPRQGGSKLAIEMSKGTQFQLYLALRLAGYEEFAMARPSVPFVADDIMETFDEPRSEEVFRLFGQMAEVGQVIYLTHHKHLCEIASEAVPAVKIHKIP
ncbi:MULTISPECIES: AAA family ATPase [unclassified Rhizobium]|uniref:AAA family ATPase n=1 Tax=unclassified Rhizobium TaxID=2613769 RepID=UPI0038137093